MHENRNLFPVVWFRESSAPDGTYWVGAY